MRWITLIALVVLTAGCGGKAAANRGTDRRGDEREVRASIGAFYADVLAGRGAQACDRLTNALRRELSGNCTSEIDHGLTGSRSGSTG